MTAKITTLIDKVDTTETVRDEIAAILKLESTNQVALATLAGKPDPQQWALDVYVEASNPFEKWLNVDGDGDTDVVPIVNVMFDSVNFDKSKGNVVERQVGEGTFNIDCYAYSSSIELEGGHTPGDQRAALESMRVARLVRNILMAATYTYLGMRGVVWSRWPASIRMFQPAFNGTQVQNVVAARLTLQVVYNEFSPQVVGELLELIQVTMERQEDGEIVFIGQWEPDPTP